MDTHLSIPPKCYDWMTHIEGELSTKQQLCFVRLLMISASTRHVVRFSQHRTLSKCKSLSHFKWMDWGGMSSIEATVVLMLIRNSMSIRKIYTISISNELIIKAQIVPLLPEEFHENWGKLSVTRWGNGCCLQVFPPWSRFFRCCDTNLSFLPGLLCPSAANPVSRSQCVIILPHRPDPSWLIVSQPLWCWTPTEAHR